MLAISGHAMLARWHLGPITGFHFWLVLVTSPEVLVFLFFMITDPKTAPRSPTHRLIYAVSLGLLASLMIAPTTTEFASKVALLASLAVVCLAIPVLRRWPVPVDRRLALVATPVVLVAFAGMIAFSSTTTATAFRALPPGALPPITILPSQGVQTQLDLHTAQLIAHDLLCDRPRDRRRPADRCTSRRAAARSPPFAVAQLAGQTYQLNQAGERPLDARRRGADAGRSGRPRELRPRRPASDRPRAVARARLPAGRRSTTACRATPRR